MKQKFLSALVFGGLFFFLPQKVFADLGPKPSMEFEIKYETLLPVYILEARQVQCEDISCSNSRELEQLGPQGFSCNGDFCHSLAYGYKPYQKIVIKFFDKTRESNVFESYEMNSNYEVIVKNNSLKVSRIYGIASKDSFKFFDLVKSFVLTIVLELLFTMLYLKLIKAPLIIMFSVLFANILSLSLYWGVTYFLEMFLGLSFTGLNTILIGELAVFFFEGTVLFIFSRKILGFWRAFTLSLYTNIFSFLAGSYILRFF